MPAYNPGEILTPCSAHRFQTFATTANGLDLKACQTAITSTPRWLTADRARWLLALGTVLKEQHPARTVAYVAWSETAWWFADFEAEAGPKRRPWPAAFAEPVVVATEGAG